ncbi:MAG TPA: flavin reductase family protein [Mycobacteriales bacterium]|nr:flavin reductase family protein [Mycobacteriales bacterium]
MSAQPNGLTDPAEAFREVFQRHAVGVAVIACGGAVPVGFTATSVVSVSADPPMLSFNIGHRTSSWPALRTAEHIAVNLLAAGQTDLARTFATSGIDRFGAAGAWRRGPHGLPVLPGVLAWLGATVRGRFAAGDHSVVIAEVTDAHYTDAEPLLYHLRGFRSFT